VIALAQGTARGIRLIDSALAVASDARLPLIGRVAAGRPLLAAEHVEAQIAVDPALFHPRADYLLRVNGLSMRDAGILDGDWLAVHRVSEAPQRAIVVARIEEEVTVKRFERRGARVRLSAENPDFAPIEVDLEHTAFALEGLAVGVIRRGFTA
jgi:repressor LexA